LFKILDKNSYILLRETLTDNEKQFYSICSGAILIEINHQLINNNIVVKLTVHILTAL